MLLSNKTKGYLEFRFFSYMHFGCMFYTHFDQLYEQLLTP